MSTEYEVKLQDSGLYYSTVIGYEWCRPNDTIYAKLNMNLDVSEYVIMNTSAGPLVLTEVIREQSTTMTYFGISRRPVLTKNLNTADNR